MLWVWVWVPSSTNSYAGESLFAIWGGYGSIMDRTCSVAYLLPFSEVPLPGDRLGDHLLPRGGGGEESCHVGGREKFQPSCPEWKSGWSHSCYLWHLLMVQVTNSSWKIEKLCHFRHPSYAGWFMWSLGSQLILINPICLLAYAYVSFSFFSERIYCEEFMLLKFFGREYREYQVFHKLENWNQDMFILGQGRLGHSWHFGL